MKVLHFKWHYLQICLCFVAVLFLAICGITFHLQTKAATADQPEELLYCSEKIDLPILMYHSILKDPKRADTYVLSPEQFETDLKYLKNHGYTTIVMADLIAYVYENQPLPEKPIMITFDDGYYNNYYYVFDILKKYQAKIVLSPIASWSEKFSNTPDPNPNYAHVTWDNLKEMTESGLVEIQNHSYNFHTLTNRKGARINQGESEAAYREIFLADTEKAQNLLKEYVGVTPTVYTYPFGAYCKESEALIKEMGFKGSFITCDKHNTITKDPNCLYKLNRYNRPAHISTEEFMQKTLEK